MSNTRKKPTAESDGLIIHGLEDRIQRARKERNLSQAQVATMIGVTRATVGAYEAGRAAPSAYYLLRIADVLQVDTDFLLGRKRGYVKALMLRDLTPMQLQAVTAVVETMTEEFHRINQSIGIDPDREDF